MPYAINKLNRIYHGVDSNVYKPINIEARNQLRQQLGVGNRFLYLYTGRTHHRKNMSYVLKAYKTIVDIFGGDKVGLWINSNFRDPMGYRLDRMIDEFDLHGKVFTMDKMASASSPLSMLQEREYNLLFGISDCLVNVAGEGFGYNVAEAFLTRTPVVCIDESALGELGGSGRALKVKPTAWMTGLEMTERPIINPKDVAKTMVQCMQMKTKDMVDTAYKWAIENLEQSVIDEQWMLAIDKFEHPLCYDLVLEAA
jgi:glycosyltransferase involved in cell wall biosynthesis